ncbi:MAG TPA: nucleotide sugar dehydrogenase [Gemmatimonadaceae bacterium]|nr:nucleotide sugar dehydrogenase [Gemmatimonadaceae bacterium]
MTHPRSSLAAGTLAYIAQPQLEPVYLREIAVVGAGVVGVPLAALFASAELWAPDGAPTRVTLVQRPSPSAGWKVGAINAGRSPVGGPEPALDDLVAQGAGGGRLRATSDLADVRDADVVIVCVQTGRRGMGPDYGHLLDALHGVAGALRQRTVGSMPLVVVESTLAPTTMQTVVRPLFAQHGLEEGRDLNLAHSPSRLVRGAVAERFSSTDKLVGAFTPEAARRLAAIYGRIVTRGTVHCTDPTTAEVVKTLENAARDVRLAYAAEVARYCDARDVDYFAVRRRVNALLAADGSVPRCGGLLVPTVGVGGQGLPRDGIYLWWRALEAGVNPARSLVLEARRINDESPAQVLALVERCSGSVAGRSIALLGVAYRANSDDARNSPTLALAAQLGARGARVSLHDPHVGAADPVLLRSGLAGQFHRDLAEALATAEVVVVCVAHERYLRDGGRWLQHGQRLRTVVDACDAYRAPQIASTAVRYAGIGRGIAMPSAALVGAVAAGLRAVERGLANEVAMLLERIDARLGADGHDRLDFAAARRLAACCVSRCELGEPGHVDRPTTVDGFRSRLVACAVDA